jgi:hypothetical protein
MRVANEPTRQFRRAQFAASLDQRAYTCDEREKARFPRAGMSIGLSFVGGQRFMAMARYMAGAAYYVRS